MNFYYDHTKAIPCDTCIFCNSRTDPRCIYMSGFMGSDKIGDGVDYVVHNAFMIIVFRRYPDRPEYNIAVCHKYKKTKAARRREYYQSPEWKQIRQQKLKEAGYVCELCGSAINLRVHHLTYDHFGCEPLDDLLVVCEKCHTRLHTVDLKIKGAI